MRAIRAWALPCAALVSIWSTSCGAFDGIWDKQLSPGWCKDHPQDADCRREFPDAGPVTCSSNASCMAPTPACDLAGTMTCVQCVAPDQTTACGSTMPACGPDHACHACSKHADCATSSACLEDGSCAMETDVAYVEPLVGTGTTCSLAMPCKKVAEALGTGRRYVKLTGTVDEPIDVHGGRVVTFLADSTTTLTRTNGNGAVITVRDDGTSLAIYDLTIRNGQNSPSSIGCLIPAGSGAPTLSLTRTLITNNAGGGISAANGSLTITQSTISGNQGPGISATGGSLTITQSTISGNQGVGISATGGMLTIARSTVSLNPGGGLSIGGVGPVFDITNTYIFRNGDENSSTFGGLSLDFAIPGTNRLAFNTIVDNRANLGAASAGGVFCDAASFVAGNNLIFRNTGGSTTTAQTFGNCTYGNSFVVAAPAADNTPQFKHPNTTPFDYHLTAETPTTIRDAAGSCSIVDHDGYQRPFGGACDLGAAEYHP